MQHSSLAQEPELGAPKPLAAWRSCHKHKAITALQQGHALGTSQIRSGHRSHPWCRRVQGSTQNPATHRLQERRVRRHTGAWKNLALPTHHPTSPVQDSLPGGGRGEAAPHRAPLGAPGTEGCPHPLPKAGRGAAWPGLSHLCHPPRKLGQVIRPGRVPEMSDSISRHSETLQPGSLASSRLRASGGQHLPHGHRAGGAPGWHNPGWGSQGGIKPFRSPGVLLPAPAALGPQGSGPCQPGPRTPALTSSPSLHLSAIPGGWSAVPAARRGVPLLPTLRRAGCCTSTGALQSTVRASWAGGRETSRET